MFTKQNNILVCFVCLKENNDIPERKKTCGPPEPRSGPPRGFAGSSAAGSPGAASHVWQHTTCEYYVCIYVYVYICIYIYVHIVLYIYIYCVLCVYIHTCIYIYIYTQYESIRQQIIERSRPVRAALSASLHALRIRMLHVGI